jgi:hypothetical protein
LKGADAEEKRFSMHREKTNGEAHSISSESGMKT